MVFTANERQYITSSNAYVLSCLFYNITSQETGASIYFSFQSGSLFVEFSTFSKCHMTNTSSYDAGGIYINPGNIIMHSICGYNCTSAGNCGFSTCKCSQINSVIDCSVAYCESHDQALVGDKTIAFWLMDKDMYTDMSCLTPPNMVISRGMALHKLIRLITIGLGGEAYLNFMGNEFGHPEWIDFPREGNGNSYLHCCRRFDLPFTDHLRYKYLLHFDNAMIALEHQERFMESEHSYITLKHEDDKVIAFEKGNLLFVFNFHTEKSFENYAIGVEWEGKYKVILSSDDEEFGGYNRIDKNTEHIAFKEPWQNRQCKLLLYIPCRTAQVLKRV